jgi:hypothetical protein
MKTNPATFAPHSKKKFAFTLAGIAQWVVLAALFLLAATYFLRNNGFIGPSDIQPYPY